MKGGCSAKVAIEAMERIIASATQTERTHKYLEEAGLSSAGTEYIRLTVPIPPIGLDENNAHILAALEELSRQHISSRETLDKLEVLKSILTVDTWVTPKSSALTRVRGNYTLWSDVNFHDYICNAKVLWMSFWYCGDNFLGAQLSTWISYFRRGIKVTMVMPNPENKELMEEIVKMVYFSTPTVKAWDVSAIAEKIKRTRRHLLEAFTAAAGNGTLEVYYVDHAQHYSIYMIDEDQALLSVFEEEWGTTVQSPTTVFDLANNERTRNFFNKERSCLLSAKRSVRSYPNE